MPGLDYVHVDVFSAKPSGGNSLPVFPDARGVEAPVMLRITQELRHFEAIFLEPTAQEERVRARVFDLFEELPFAGHPILGAAVVLHQRSQAAGPGEWQFALRDKTVAVTVRPTSAGYFGLMDQGGADFVGQVKDRSEVAEAFSLSPVDLDRNLPLEVVSTGLRYLIIPVRPGALPRARIRRDITPLLRNCGAQFAVLLDEGAREIRHWNNDGVIEDVATGSAAGTIGAYRLRHGLARGGEPFILHQGRFTGRASEIHVQPEGDQHCVEAVKVGGDVALVGHGTLDLSFGALA